MTPAPAYKSATADSYGTYFCNFRSKVSKAWKNEEGRQEACQIIPYRLNVTATLNDTTLDIFYMVIAHSTNLLSRFLSHGIRLSYLGGFAYERIVPH